MVGRAFFTAIVKDGAGQVDGGLKLFFHLLNISIYTPYSITIFHRHIAYYIINVGNEDFIFLKNVTMFFRA